MLKFEKERIVFIGVITIAIVVGMYDMSLINMHTSWFGVYGHIEIVSKYLLYLLPLLFFVSLVKPLTKFVGLTMIVILILSLFFGFVYVGVDNMVTDYLYITIINLILIFVVTVLVLRNLRKVDFNSTQVE